MATISQLMQSRVPGEIRIQLKGWDDGSYFIPQFKDAFGTWHGTTPGGRYLGYRDAYSPDWELYTEPKKMVARYQWAVVTYGVLYSTTLYFASEEDLRKEVSGVEWCQRLDYTKIEVEEEAK